MRTHEAEEVARLVQNTEVRSGKWKSPYDIYDWRLIANIPWRLQPALEAIRLITHPLQEWEPEAFIVERDTPELTSIDIAMRSRKGRSPLNARLFGRPTLPLREVLHPVLLDLVEKAPIKLRYREFQEIQFPMIFALKSEGNQVDYDPDSIPAYDRVVIKPFWFFQGEDDKERAVAEDPFRLVLNMVGAPLGVMRRFFQMLGVDKDMVQSLILQDAKDFTVKLKAHS